MRLLLYLLLPFIVTCCEDSWAEFNGHCYRRFSLTGRVDENVDYFCRGYGAHMVSITSDGERDFVMSMTSMGESTAIQLQTAIGAYRNSTYGSWKWWDGTPFNENSRFVSGGPHSNGLCAYLLSDKLVDYKNRASTTYSHYYFSGRTGIFVSGECYNTAHMFVCKKKDTTNRRTEKMCGSEWTTLGSNCYKRFSVPTINVSQSENYCQARGGHLISVTTEEEKNLVVGMTQQNIKKYWTIQPVVGCYRTTYLGPWSWYDGTPFNQSDWFYVDMISTEYCCQLFPDPCISPLEKYPDDLYYHGVIGKFCTARCSFNAHEFICEKKGCDLSVSTSSGGSCACNTGFIDITETTLLEAKNYAKGEKCIPNQCHVKKDTSILFIIDSSESITKEQWPKMISFIQSAANKLPTKFKVGFLKFSTKAAKGKWLKPGWNAADFKKAIPSKNDEGMTNTPAALKRAKEMFSKDRSKEQIAVLITDGLPVSEEYESEDEAQKATVKAAKNLQKDDVRLIVMGIGPQIFVGKKKVQEWVKNFDRDFHLNLGDVGNLNDGDMDILVKKVCN